MVRITVGRKKSSLDSTLQIIKLIMATVLSSSSSATKTSSAASLLRLYGVPLSQPFRSVAWTLLLHRVSFTIQLTVPGAKTSIGSRNENYLKLTNGRSNVIPILQVEEDGRDGTFTIMESPAILTYICERYGSGAARYSSTDQAHADNWLLPPRASKEKTMVDSYMHWHHSNTRRLTRLTAPTLLPQFNLAIDARHIKLAKSTLTTLDTNWLGGGGGNGNGEQRYLAGTLNPTIADILAYEELSQVHHVVSTDVVDLSSYTNIWCWMQRMKQLPYYEQVHKALETFSSTSSSTSDNMPIQKRLSIANKVGLKAINEAQQDTYKSSNLSSKL